VKIKNILTVLDKPKHAQTALAEAVKLQQLTAAHLDLAAFRHNALYDHEHAFDAKQRKQLKHQVVEECKEWMVEQAGSLTDTANTRMRTIWSKDIAGWLVDEVSERPVDLVIKSLHLKKELMYTPTDWQILRTCTAPVMLKTTGRRKKSSGVILAALDFSRDDAKRRRLNKKVMDAAACMAELSGSTVHIVYALEFSTVLRDLDIIDVNVNKKSVLARIMPNVERFLAPYGISKSRMHFPVGKAGQVINSKAHKLNADLLVLGTGVHRLRRAVGLGSTTEKVLTRANRDVLTIHS
jgi:universal stress protein E